MVPRHMEMHVHADPVGGAFSISTVPSIVGKPTSHILVSFHLLSVTSPHYYKEQRFHFGFFYLKYPS
jgi:hypothetical protein